MKKTNLKGLSKTQTIIITVIVTVLIVVLIPLGIYSGVNRVSPIKAVQDAFTPDTQQIIGKWQDEKAILGYEFYEDGTYDYHVSSDVTITKDYKLEGNKLSLIEYNTNASVVYKIKLSNDTLTMTLVESNGKEPEKDMKTVTKYNKVKNFNLKTPLDAISEFAEEAKAENPDTTESDKQEEKNEAETEKDNG